MTPEENGLLALASLQKMILELRSFYELGRPPDPLWIKEEWAPEAARWLRILDLYLTGNEDNRREDEQRLKEFAVDVRLFHVYLSDGGYSRLTLRPEEGSPVVLDRSLSTKKVTGRWDALG